MWNRHQQIIRYFLLRMLKAAIYMDLCQKILLIVYILIFLNLSEPNFLINLFLSRFIIWTKRRWKYKVLPLKKKRATYGISA